MFYSHVERVFVLKQGANLSPAFAAQPASLSFDGAKTFVSSERQHEMLQIPRLLAGNRVFAQDQPRSSGCFLR